MHYSGQDMLWLIGSLSRIFRIPFDPQLIRQQFPPPYSRTSFLNALQALEFKVGERNLDAKTLASLEHIPFPAVAFLRDSATAKDTAQPEQSIESANTQGEEMAPAEAQPKLIDPVLLIKANDGKVLFFRAGAEAPETIALNEFFKLFRTDILLIARKEKSPTDLDEASAASNQKEPTPFGFKWFIPELMKHKRIWRDVLIASLAIQLVGLVTPLFTQVIIASARATLTSSSRKLEQISADYRQRLQAERADISDKLDKTQAEVTKQEYRNGLLELKAPQDGIIKDVATHTIGTVISPGTILMTLVPKDEILRAEVWVSNEDVGFIHQGDSTKIKFASYQFQKYGMVDGQVAHLSADATDNTQQGAGSAAPPTAKSPNGQPYSYRALVDLKAQELIVDGIKHTLSPGMQVTAEIHLGTRTIFEYLLSPVMKAFQEAGRER